MGKINWVEFNPVPPRSVASRFLQPYPVGVLLAGMVAYYITLREDFSPEPMMWLPAETPEALTQVPLMAYIIVGCFAMGVLVGRFLQYMHRQALSSLLTYTDWITKPTSTKTKLWGLSVKLLSGPGPHSTFAFQENLPSLPLPDMNQTLDKWLSFSRVILNEEDFNQTKSAVEEFRHADGPLLQRHLFKKYMEKQSWLSDYWRTAAYLRFRESLILPNPVIACRYSYRVDQLAKASNVIWSVARQAKMIQDETLPIGLIQGFVPICYDMYREMYGAVRIPGHPFDCTAVYPDSKHILVIRKGHFYSLDVYAKDESGVETALLPTEVYDHLMYICAMVEDEEEPAPVSVMTSLERPKWCKARNILKKNNAESLREVESAIAVIILETSDGMEGFCEGQGNFYGDYQMVDPKVLTRWLDKSLNITIYNDSTIEAYMEHTFYDGMVINSFFDFFHVTEKYENGTLPRALRPPRDSPRPKKLHWDLGGLEFMIAEARNHYIALSNDLQSRLMVTPYGKDFIKCCHLSPDAYIQLSLQLAFYRLHKETTRTYSAASHRLFLLGRTETVQTASSSSKAWVEAMDNPKATNIERETLLREAARSHVKQNKIATSGQGYERHLLGMYCAATELGMELPKIFKDKAWLSPYKLSTSNVPTRNEELGIPIVVYAALFGPACHDGYGICYTSVSKDKFGFSITSYKSNSKTDSLVFEEVWMQSLLDMKQLLAPKGKQKLSS